MSNGDTVSVLELSLHGAMVGYLAGYRDARTILTFTPEFVANAARPTFSLITHPAFPKAEEIMAKPWVKRQKLHPVLSNLLPEGALRDYLAQALKTHALEQTVDSRFAGVNSGLKAKLFLYRQCQLGQQAQGSAVDTLGVA